MVKAFLFLNGIIAVMQFKNQYDINHLLMMIISLNFLFMLVIVGYNFATGERMFK
jgi:hypothetical protein